MQQHTDSSSDYSSDPSSDVEPDPESDSAAHWESHYSRLDPDWGSRANPVLRDLVGIFAPTPGTALDVGCGHGGDAVWLAGLGWDVTAVDVARTALDRVADAARAAGVSDRVRPVRHDLARTFPAGTFDLVNASYFHTPVEIPRAQVLRRAAAAVAPDGLLILVEHASSAPWSSHFGQDVRFPTAAETFASLDLGDGWHTERCDEPRRVATGPHGETAPVVENVIVVRRTGK
ncbi:class I SAM-dependent methyltransferase [Yinghuangia sp. YIM S09857]|uniref:class I SAM-dependent methyltransferase n=1 Tax=Yinghuangia sp. YIM S09857 TaxID=3436929 RepID=UPI003F539107